jgi:phospholipid/cholesterol/gamma-HCH transport system permease protein
MVIGTISVSQGFSTTLGATGVGRSTQRSVIVNFLLILMLGYMVTRVFYR